MGPDLDAVASVWILKKFGGDEYAGADVDFALAGNKIAEGKLADKGIMPDEVVHVDTGMGKFDHHTEELAHEPVCAASLVRDHLIVVHPELDEDEALARMVRHFVEIDHFEECYWPEANNDRYLFQLHEVVHFLKNTGLTDREVVEFSRVALDAVYAAVKVRVAAEEEVERGREFETKWGKAVAIETPNDEVMHYGQKKGYQVVVRKDPEIGNIRIKAVPGKKIDLTKIYEKITELDPEATWYLHPGKTMLLNGSRKHEGQVPSKLSLEQVVELLKLT